MLSFRVIFRIFVWISLSIPLYFIVGAMQYVKMNWELKFRGIALNAEIIYSEKRLVNSDNGDYYIYYYTVSFKDTAGNSYNSRLSKSKDVLPKGSSLAILYLANDPSIVKRDQNFQLIWYPLWNFIGTLILWLLISLFWVYGFLKPVIWIHYWGYSN